MTEFQNAIAQAIVRANNLALAINELIQHEDAAKGVWTEYELLDAHANTLNAKERLEDALRESEA